MEAIFIAAVLTGLAGQPAGLVFWRTAGSDGGVAAETVRSAEPTGEKEGQERAARSDDEVLFFALLLIAIGAMRLLLSFIRPHRIVRRN